MNEFSFRRSWGPNLSIPRVLNYKRPSDKFIHIAGPCSVQSPEQIRTIAKHVASCGATHLRGGVFRAGTYPPKNFGWVDMDLIKAFSDAAWSNGLKNIIEVLDYTSLSKIAPYADCFQVGARQMQNYNLLKHLSKTDKQVFLKRNPGSTLDEWLGSAEYLLENGTCDPVLIERGSSTHENHVRWSLSVSMIPAVKSICDIPVIVDASHGSGRRDLVAPLTLAGIAAGADGCLIETHPEPEKSISDKDQALSLEDYKDLITKVNKLRSIL